MRFLVDECLAPRLADVLRAAGHDAVTVVGQGLAGAADPVVLGVAREQDRVILSADTDFGELLSRSGADLPSVVLFRGDEVDPDVLGDLLIVNLPPVQDALVSGAIVVIHADRIRVRNLPIRRAAK